jgi:hypothetical protein
MGAAKRMAKCHNKIDEDEEDETGVNCDGIENADESDGGRS